MTHRGPARPAARPLASSSSSASGAPAARHTAPPRRLPAVIALVALIGGGCANAPTGTGSGAGENPGGATPNPAELQELQKKLPEYAERMRENGVPDFPDPGADGTIHYYGAPDPQEFTSASEKCDLLPADRGRNR